MLKNLLENWSQVAWQIWQVVLSKNFPITPFIALFYQVLTPARFGEVIVVTIYGEVLGRE